MSSGLNFVYVGLGGAAGACLRYSFSLALAGYSARLPLATLSVNVIGALIAGFLATYLWSRGLFGTPIHLLLVVGFLGGFTTFSAFSVETLRLLESGGLGSALWNVALNVIGSLLAVSLGAYLVQLLMPAE